MLVGSLTCFLIESVNRISIQLEQDIVNIQIAFTVGTEPLWIVFRLMMMKRSCWDYSNIFTKAALSRIAGINERSCGIMLPMCFLFIQRFRKEKALIKLLIISAFDEPKPGLEPGTYSLRMNCSTNWAISATVFSAISGAFLKKRCKYISFFRNKETKSG